MNMKKQFPCRFTLTSHVSALWHGWMFPVEETSTNGFSVVLPSSSRASSYCAVSAGTAGRISVAAYNENAGLEVVLCLFVAVISSLLYDFFFFFLLNFVMGLFFVRILSLCCFFTGNVSNMLDTNWFSLLSLRFH